MKVIVPYATQSPMLPAVRLALTQDGWEATFHHCDKEDSYHSMMLDLWNAKEDFCVIEHDIVVWPGALQDLADCKELWCTRPYYCSIGWIIDGLGCTRFAQNLIELYPNFLLEPFPSCCNHTRYYCGLDRLIAHRMQDLGIKPHVHLPGVSNLNERWT